MTMNDETYPPGVGAILAVLVGGVITGLLLWINPLYGAVSAVVIVALMVQHSRSARHGDR